MYALRYHQPQSDISTVKELFFDNLSDALSYAKAISPEGWVVKIYKRDISRGTKWVNVYSFGRAYGGPEEGGWYYDTWEVVESFPVEKGGAITAVRMRAARQYGADNKGSHYSVEIEDGPGVSGNNYQPFQ